MEGNSRILGLNDLTQPPFESDPRGDAENDMASSSEPQGQADAMVLAPAVGVGVPSLPPDTRHTLLKTATMPKKELENS